MRENDTSANKILSDKNKKRKALFDVEVLVGCK